MKHNKMAWQKKYHWEYGSERKLNWREIFFAFMGLLFFGIVFFTGLYFMVRFMVNSI